MLILVLVAGCFGRSSVNGVARADGGEGDSCTVDAHCQFGLVCIDEQCLLAGTGLIDLAAENDASADLAEQPAECPRSQGVVGPGDLVRGSTVGEPDEAEGSCGGGGAGEHIWTLEVLAGDRPLWADTGGSTFDTVLYIRTECDDPQSELSCNDDDPEMGVQSRLNLEDLGPGRYYIVVDGFGTDGSYVLDLTEDAPEDSDSNSDP